MYRPRPWSVYIFLPYTRNSHSKMFVISLCTINLFVFQKDKEFSQWCTNWSFVCNVPYMNVNFKRVRKNCDKRLLASSCLSVRPHEATRLPLNGFSFDIWVKQSNPVTGLE